MWYLRQPKAPAATSACDLRQPKALAVAAAAAGSVAGGCWRWCAAVLVLSA